MPFCSLNRQENLNSFVESLLEPLGQVLILEEETLLSPATVAGASGLGFVLELMEYWLNGFREKFFLMKLLNLS